MSQAKRKKTTYEVLVVVYCLKQLTTENIAKIAKEVVACCEKEKDNSNLKHLTKLLRDSEMLLWNAEMNQYANP
jgi:23S rRNA maturation mini-RNase III